MPTQPRDTLASRLKRFAREPLAHLPTPLRPMPRLSKALGGPPIWIKRDDCTGLATGGNKARKLEFLVGEAREQGADGIVTFGAVQSNHARQTAAAAAAAGLECHLILVANVDYREPAWEVSGNRLLDELLGAEVRVVENEAAAAKELGELLGRAESDGRKFYVVPVGGSSAVGALGYVSCALELIAQAESQQIAARTVVNATSSLGTQAGLLVGFHASESDMVVRSVNVSAPDEQEQGADLRRLCDATAELLDVPSPPDDRLHIEPGFRGDSYGVPTEAMHEAIETVARLEGILLDPVYTGKAMAWLMDAIRNGKWDDEDAVVFLHTGGSPGLFAYQASLATHLTR